MLLFEIYKLVKRKLVLIVLAGIFVFLLFDIGQYCRVYYFDRERHQRNQYEMTQFEKNKGILTDERLDDFIAHYEPDERYVNMGIIDDFIVHFTENGKGKSLTELFPLVNFNIHFGYYQNWVLCLMNLQSHMKYIFAFVVVAFSSLFTYEKECGMQEILLSMKYGRKKCTTLKIGTAFLITNGLYLLVLIVSTVPQIIMTRGIGWDTSIQMITWLMDSTVNMNNLMLLFHIALLSFLSINTILLVTLFASFLANNPMVPMCVSLGILFVLRPDIIGVSIGNNIVNRITALTPLNVIDVMNVVRQTPISIGGMKIHCLTIAEIAYTLILVTGSIIFFRVLAKHQKYYAS